MLRTHDAGTLRASDAGTTVTLAGWVARRRDHGGVVFLDLRDASGYVQVVVREEEAHDLRNEYCVLVTGEVRRRPEGNENPELPTGEIEVATSELRVLSAAAPLPFPIETDQAAVATTSATSTATSTCAGRARPGPCGCARRSAGSPARSCTGTGSPRSRRRTLTRSTPEGARDFVVPVRLQPGKWYALPQSPQLFKQLLMIGGLERYYQIARCFRDEDFRADRQPEFTQLDFEMSFVDRDDVLAVAEDVVRALWRELASYEVPEIPRMTYREAMDRFGSDKPDLRFGIELTELTDYFAETPFRVFQSPYVGRGRDARRRFAAAAGVRRVAGLGEVARRPRAGLRDHRRGRHARRAGRQEHLRRRARRAWSRPSGAKPGDCVFFAAGAAPHRRRSCWARRATRSPSGWSSSSPAPGRSCSSSTSRCSRRPRTATGPSCTTRSPRPRPSGATGSPRTRARRCPTPTTW